MHGIHVHLVHIGPLLTIDLDIEEVGIHESGSLLIFKRFVLHDVAPVTGTVPDADDHQLVLGSRLFPNRIAPWMPIHRVVLVLFEVRGGGPCKSIHVHGVRLTQTLGRPNTRLLLSGLPRYARRFAALRAL